MVSFSIKLLIYGVFINRKISISAENEEPGTLVLSLVVTDDDAKEDENTVSILTVLSVQKPQK